MTETPQVTRPVKASPLPVEPKLNLADYVASEAQPPPSLNRTGWYSRSLMRDALGNNDWGDCGDAMVLHGIGAMRIFAGANPPPFVTGDALRLYSAVSGFDINAGPPGHNRTDRGTDNQKLVDHWRNVGVTCAANGVTHKIAGSLFVDPKDQRLSMLAMYEFDVLFRAVGLPKTAQGQQEWKLVDPSLKGNAAVGSWGYHDIPYVSYDENGVDNDTWGEDGRVDWDFDHAYGVQGFVVVTHDMLNQQGVSPAGVNWTQLTQDLAKFPAVPSS